MGLRKKLSRSILLPTIFIAGMGAIFSFVFWARATTINTMATAESAAMMIHSSMDQFLSERLGDAELLSS